MKNSRSHIELHQKKRAEKGISSKIPLFNALEIGTEINLIIKSDIQFFDTSIRVDSISVIIPDSDERKLFNFSKNKAQFRFLSRVDFG